VWLVNYLSAFLSSSEVFLFAGSLERTGEKNQKVILCEADIEAEKAP